MVRLREGLVKKFPCYTCEGRGWSYDTSGTDTIVCAVCDGEGKIKYDPQGAVPAAATEGRRKFNRHEDFFGAFDKEYLIFMGIMGVIGIWLYSKIIDLMTY